MRLTSIRQIFIRNGDFGRLESGPGMIRNELVTQFPDGMHQRDGSSKQQQRTTKTLFAAPKRSNMTWQDDSYQIFLMILIRYIDNI